MFVRVSAYAAGGLYAYRDGIDLSGDVPGSTNEFLWDVAYLDTDGTIGWAQSAAQTLAAGP